MTLEAIVPLIVVAGLAVLFFLMARGGKGGG
jgi:hypothetical protein